MNPTQLAKTLDTIIDRLDQLELTQNNYDNQLTRLKTRSSDFKLTLQLIEQQLAAIERAATCGTGPNEPCVDNSPAQADVGEVSAESEWPRYVGPHESSVSGAWANGCILIRFDSASSKGVEIFPSKADKAWYGDWAAMEYRRFGMGWKDVPRAEAEARIAAARGEKPQTVVEWAESIGVPFPADTDSHGCPVPPRSAPDDQPPFHVGQVVEAINSDCVAIRNGERLTVAAITEDGHLHFDNKPSLNYPAWCFRPIPAPVEQGPTSEGMKAAAENIAKWQLEAGQEQLKFQATCEQFIVTHVGPELAAKDAEITRLKADNVRLKDDCTVAGNNIGYRSGELQEYRLEVERLKKMIANDRPNGKWLDRYGSCRVCGGEIPLGHSMDCDLWKLERQVSDAKKFADNIAAAVNGWEFGTRNAYMRDLLIGQIADLRSQLTAATAANVERDRDHEAMEVIAKGDAWNLQSFNGYREWRVVTHGGKVHLGPTPTAAILAARDAAEGNG